MNYRIATLKATEGLTTDGTKVFNINVKDIISRIAISWRETGVAANDFTAQAAAGVTKLEIIDGSEVLHSLSGLENQALCLYDRKNNTMVDGTWIAAMPLTALLGIDFGRKLWDGELAFDPTKFTNPQLKITYDIDAATGTSTTTNVEAWAYCFDEKVISPIGFLMAKEHYSYTPSTEDTVEEIMLPTDFPLRKMLIRGYHATREPSKVLKTVRLDEDNDKRVIFNLDTDDLQMLMKGDYPALIDLITGYSHTGADYTKYATPTEFATGFGGLAQGDDPKTVYSASSHIKGGYIDLRCSESAMVMGLVVGWLPNHCFCLPFGDQDDIGDWFDVTRVGKLRLRLTAEEVGSAGNAQVILQQLRRY